MKLLFSVSVQHRNDGKLFVDGRNCYEEIKVGDTFHGLRDADFVYDKNKAIFCPAKPAYDFPVKTKVLSIYAYGHYLDELSPGMTARLELSIDIFEEIKGECFLYTNTVEPRTAFNPQP